MLNIFKNGSLRRRLTAIAVNWREATTINGVDSKV
jgi:hypothetical protein